MAYLLQHLLIDSARRHPNKVAVVYRDESITYGRLDEITSRLAVVLRENGVKKGDRVGILINKSIPSIISIHGILKAGGVYVPLDPSAPPSRSGYMIQNCGIRCLLTSTRQAQTLPQMFPAAVPLEVVVLTDDCAAPAANLQTKTVAWADVIDRGDARLPENSTIETDLAYILYTSGSTGVPKGVMISHLNSLTFVNWGRETFGVGSEDRLSNHAPLHFDLSIFDVFVAFGAGATVVLVPEGTSAFPIRLADWIENNGISIWYSVPSALSLMVLHGRLDRYRFSKLHTILFAGEVFPVKYLRELMGMIPHAGYFNLYGPTETNVVTYCRVPKLTPDRVKPIPIGEACANTEVFALTDGGTLVTQPGQEGELYARGSCVAQGYWGDMEKTRQNFVLNQTQPHFQEKAYRTGDLVTLDEEGNYIYLGRRDNMIKSRGYRIELGEVESVLYSHPQVTDAAVVALHDDVIGNRIHAFVVLNDNGAVDSSELQRFCAGRIPTYMVPETIDLRRTLPQTTTGKVDKVALRALAEETL